MIEHHDTTWQPQRLFGSHKNPDRVHQIAGLVVASAAGAVDDGKFGVRVAAVDDREVLVVTEDLCPWIEHPDELCAVHERTDDVTEDECFQRCLQTKQAFRDTFSGNEEDSRREIQITLPSRVEPTSLKWECIGHPKNGCGVCHIDMLEKGKLNQQCVKMLLAKKMKNGLTKGQQCQTCSNNKNFSKCMCKCM